MASKFNFVLLGGSGDLALGKLLPALYYLDRDHLIADSSIIIAAARSDLSQQAYLELVENALLAQLPGHHFDRFVWQRFAKRLHYTRLDAGDSNSFAALKSALAHTFAQQQSVYYLSMPPDLFTQIGQALDHNGLIRADSCIVLEKPLGEDLASSQVINDELIKYFDEPHIYRIDHYLGKETVQNLLALRFANALFEPLWNNQHISNVQITVSETVGVEGRWQYYDSTGCLRDMIQNHLLQLLSLVAMGVPVNLKAESVRAEKIKVLKSLALIKPQKVEQLVVRGQYSEGMLAGEMIPAYTQEQEGTNSNTETFVALRADIHNWRWRGVPFYLRTGKRLPARYSEIVIQFKDVPHSIFPPSTALQANKLVIRLQPNESIQLFKMNKVPGLSNGMSVLPVTLNLSLPDTVVATRAPLAYERLIYDLLRGDSTLFVHREEVEAAWRWCDNILDAWEQQLIAPHEYTAGSWGPQAAFELTARYGHSWHESK